MVSGRAAAAHLDLMTESRVSRAFQPGDVLTYSPADRWCREGMAVVNDAGIAFDTFWASAGDAYRLGEADLRSAEFLFNIGNYRELDRHERYTFSRFAPEDRATITSQHGLQRRLFVRHGAVEDRETIIENARQKVREAEEARDAAERQVTYARESLARIEAGNDW